MEVDRQNRISLQLAEEGEGEANATAAAPAADAGGEEG